MAVLFFFDLDVGPETVILILRTYALYERNLKIAVIMAVFALIVIGVGIVRTSFLTPPNISLRTDYDFFWIT